MNGALWPLGIYFLLVLVLAAGMLGVSYVLGQRRRRDNAEVYESGMLPTGSARLRYSSEFYLVAMFFVIFDLETVFVIAWAVVLRKLGWPGYWAILLFIGTLLASLAYLWRMGALNWSVERRQHDQDA